MSIAITFCGKKFINPNFPFFCRSKKAQSPEYNMTSTQSISRILSLSLLVLLLVSCKSAQSSSSVGSWSHHSSNRTIRQADRIFSHCEKHQVEQTLEFEGCDPIRVTYQICRGSCHHTHYVVLDQPSPILECSCCRASEYIVKVKKLDVNCGGNVEKKRVFIPRIKSCGCVNCSP